MSKLILVKALHTAVWMFFVGCIVAVPVAAVWHRFVWAEVMAGLVSIECLVLASNKWRCPLTDLASRYTDDPNFDIYLPEWLALHNKKIFGSLFVADILFLVWQFGG